MPNSFQAPSKQDTQKDHGHSQSTQSNTSVSDAVIAQILDHKGRAVVSVDKAKSLSDAAQILEAKNIGALIVVGQGGAIEGILSERDIVRAVSQDPTFGLSQKISSIMTTSVKTCAETDTIIDVLARMSHGRFRHMPVVSTNGLCGIITIGDLVNFRLTQLEHEALQLKQLIVG